MKESLACFGFGFVPNHWEVSLATLHWPQDPVAEPVPDPVQPDSGARSSEIPKLTLQSLVAHVDSLDARLRDTFQAMSSRGDCDMAQNDATVLVTAADLMKVDVILESGTAGGYSTEFMARFFQNQKVQITTDSWQSFSS